MKTLAKTIILFTILSMPVLSQTYMAAPDPPQALSWGDEKFSEKEEQEYLNKLSAEVKKELLEVKKLDEKKYYSLLRRTSFLSLPSIYSISGSGISVIGDEDDSNSLRKQISEMEIKSEALGIKYQHADQSDRQKLADQLKTTLSKVFDLRETQRKEEIVKLEKKLSELKESIKIRNDNKQQIVDERFKTLTGKGKYLKWD